MDRARLESNRDGRSLGSLSMRAFAPAHLNEHERSATILSLLCLNQESDRGSIKGFHRQTTISFISHSEFNITRGGRAPWPLFAQYTRNLFSYPFKTGRNEGELHSLKLQRVPVDT